jgi:hypothetical protein
MNSHGPVKSNLEIRGSKLLIGHWRAGQAGQVSARLSLAPGDSRRCQAVRPVAIIEPGPANYRWEGREQWPRRWPRQWPRMEDVTS